MTEPLDVLIVGGGPVGVATSLLLARRGFRVRVLERSTEIYDLPRAIVMDDEIQRVFQSAGLADELRAITTPMLGAEFVGPDGVRVIGVDLPVGSNWPLGHHPVVCYYQPELEAMLRREATGAGVDLRLGVDVVEVSQSATSASVVARRGSETESHAAAWLIAADGAASPIRKSLGIAFVDQGFDQDWLVLDVRLRREVPSLPTCTQQLCDPLRPATFVPGHAHYRRWEFQLQPGESRDAMTRPERVWELLQPWLTPDDAELIRAVVYRFHATVADRMREGRIFLAGDSAHQMPPFLGQGLCSGIRDGANLAWKLEAVALGSARDDLLDTYGEERLPHAAGVVAHAVDTGKLIDRLAGRGSGDEADLGAAYGGARPFPNLTGSRLRSGHPWVGRQLPQPTVHGRWLDELVGPGFALLTRPGTNVGAQQVDDPTGIRWRTVVLDDDTLVGVVPPNGAVLVRPDRYVAAVLDEAELTDSLSALNNVFRQVFDGLP